jgi:hypothetical protein
VTLLLAATLAAGLSGCGSGGSHLSKSAYEAKLRSLSTRLTTSLKSFAAFQPTDLAAAPGFLARVADTLDGVARTLAGIRPPKDAQTLHRQLIEGASSAASELHRLARQLTRASSARSKQLLAEFDPARLAGLRELQQAAAGLAAKGYRFTAVPDG